MTLPLSKLTFLSFLLATALASGQAVADSMPGQAPQTDSGMAAPAMPPKAAALTGAEDRINAPSASAMEMLDALRAVTHSSDGTQETLEVPDRLRALIMSRDKASGIIKPAGGGGGEPKQIAKTTDYPYTTIGILNNGCSGVLIGKRFVLTAGFCVYDPDKKTWYDKVDFWPAVDAGKAPFGSVAWKKSYAPKGFVEGNDWNYNFGLIELDRDIGDQTGWMGFGYNEGDFPYTELNLTGFPAGVPDFTMWEVVCKFGGDRLPKADPKTNFVFYGCPGKTQLQGANGGPLWTIDKENNGPSVRGVHLVPYQTSHSATALRVRPSRP